MSGGEDKGKGKELFGIIDVCDTHQSEACSLRCRLLVIRIIIIWVFVLHQLNKRTTIFILYFVKILFLDA